MRRLMMIAGMLVLAVMANAASWTWQQVPMQGNLTTGSNAFFLVYHPSVGKVMLAFDSGDGKVKSYLLDPPIWKQVGNGYMMVPAMPTPSYFYLKSQGLVFDMVLQQPLLFGICQALSSTQEQVMMPYLGSDDGQWTWAYRSWKNLDPEEQGAFNSIYDSNRQRTVLVGLDLLAEIGAWTYEFDGKDYQRISQAEELRFSSGVAGFDPGTGRTVFFGKVRDNHGPETAEYSGAAWTMIDTAQAPRKDGLMTPLAHVPALGGLVGVEQAADGAVTWVYREGNWQAVPVDQRFTPRPGARVAYDEARERLVLFGGILPDGKASAEVWELVPVPGHQRPVGKP